MKVRAIAARDPRCNAVGTVELECTTEGLRLVYLALSSFADGYAPSLPSDRTELCVPWGGVRTANIEDDQLFLAIDPELSPLNRMTLRNFSTGPVIDHRELYRRRLIVRVAVVAALVVCVLLASVAAPRASEARPALFAVLVAVGAAALLLALGLIADRWLLGGSAAALRDRLAFFGELSHYLPAISARARRPAGPRAPLDWVSERFMPRSTSAIVIALSASSLAALLTGKWLFDRNPATDAAQTTQTLPAPQPQAPPAVAPFATAPATTAPETSAPAAPAPAPPTATPASSGAQSGPCSCERSDSVLWRNPLPRLSPLLIEQSTRAHKDHSHLELELGLVNNGNQVLNEITLHVQFYERGKGGKQERVPQKSRPLYFEGPLLPGHAIKWHVEARGTEFEVDNPHPEPLTPQQMAPKESFYDLLSSANHRPVRLHGAMVLAALGDEARARDGALSLRDALREEEAPYLDRLMSATGPIAVCQISVAKAGTQRRVQACIHNRSPESNAGARLRVRALDRLFDHRSPVAPPPIVIAEVLHRLPEPLSAAQGRFFSFDLDTSNPDGLKAETFEILVDETD